jgi:hypothetical protein
LLFDTINPAFFGAVEQGAIGMIVLSMGLFMQYSTMPPAGVLLVAKLHDHSVDVPDHPILADQYS